MTIAGHGEKCAPPPPSRLDQQGPQRCVWACERLMVNSVTLAPLGMLQAGAFPVSRRWMNAGVNELWLPRVPLHLSLSPPSLRLLSSTVPVSLLSQGLMCTFSRTGLFFFPPVFAISYVPCSFKYFFCNPDVNVLKQHKWSRMDLFCVHVNIHRSDTCWCFSSPPVDQESGEINF